MPAVTANTLNLPRLPELPVTDTNWRPVGKIVHAQTFYEGEGFKVRRPFPAPTWLSPTRSWCWTTWDPSNTAPSDAKGAPWHPHRGFETVTNMIDAAMEHTDSIGCGGLITDSATQWMTAGASISFATNDSAPQ
jgi:hypothetical protein